MAISDTGFDDLGSATWDDRIATGEKCEKNFARYILEKYGLHAIEQKPMSRDTEEVRHFPDIGILELPNTYWQIAYAGRSDEFEGNVIKEKASIYGAEKAAGAGRQIFVIWEMPDGDFKGNYPNKLKLLGELTDISRSHGSETPGYVFSGGIFLRNLDEILECLMAETP